MMGWLMHAKAIESMLSGTTTAARTSPGPYFSPESKEDWLRYSIGLGGPLPVLLQVHDREESLRQGRVARHLHAQVQAAARIDRHEGRYLFQGLSVLYLEAIPYPMGEPTHVRL